MKLPTVECCVCGKKGFIRLADAEQVESNWQITFSIPNGWHSQSAGTVLRQKHAIVKNLWCSMACIGTWAGMEANRIHWEMFVNAFVEHRSVGV